MRPSRLCAVSTPSRLFPVSAHSHALPCASCSPALTQNSIAELRRAPGLTVPAALPNSACHARTFTGEHEKEAFGCIAELDDVLTIHHVVAAHDIGERRQLGLLQVAQHRHGRQITLEAVLETASVHHHKQAERVSIEGVGGGRVLCGPDRARARRIVQQRQLAKHAARRELLELLPVGLCKGLKRTRVYHVALIAGVAMLDDEVTRVEFVLRHRCDAPVQ